MSCVNRTERKLATGWWLFNDIFSRESNYVGIWETMSAFGKLCPWLGRLEVDSIFRADTRFLWVNLKASVPRLNLFFYGTSNFNKV